MNHYPHHIGDYLKDTAHLDPLEDGIYRRMIDLYYTQEGPLSNDTERLCRRLRLDYDKYGATVRDLLNEFFEPSETGWVQERCERELLEYKGRADIARQNGMRGGRPKKNPENPAGSQQKTQRVISGFQKITHEKANQNQEPEPIKKPLSGKPDAKLSEGFQKFWAAWPKGERKQGKAQCASIWQRKGLEVMAETIIAHVESMKQSESWRGGYDPMPETYLNKRRWDGAELDSVRAKPWFLTWPQVVEKGKKHGLLVDDFEIPAYFKQAVLHAEGVTPEAVKQAEKEWA